MGLYQSKQVTQKDYAQPHISKDTTAPTLENDESTNANIHNSTTLSTHHEDTNDIKKPQRTTTDADRKKKKKNQIDQSKLSGFALVQYKCRKERKLYNNCFSKWYGAAVMSARLEIPRDKCDDLFENYRRCIYLGMKETWERQGDGSQSSKVRKGSALAEFMEDEGEGDD
mmetsp:Transcript_51962/g.62491  ORF Transcript_51962/g.62491 Transcript_51962/m.62491 type:complete len:170 (+) Transcript_51962:29-538(+)